MQRRPVRPATMNYTRSQLDTIARQLLKEGFFFYRLDFVWGRTPSFRNAGGTRFYFIHHGEILAPWQMLSVLRESWRPTILDEVMFAKNRLVSHFAALPSDIPGWSGPSLREMLTREEEVHAGFGEHGASFA